MKSWQQKELIERLDKHAQDYVEGRVQSFSDVCADCGRAAQVIDELACNVRLSEDACELLDKRLRHLLCSDTIREYDAKTGMTGMYIRDINDLDMRMGQLLEIERLYKEEKRTPDPVANSAHAATREDILERAAECVCGHREQDYGSPEDNFVTIAQLWTAYSKYDFDAVDVAMMMALLKIARISSGHGSEDSFVDLAGYAACGGEIAAKRNL